MRLTVPDDEHILYHREAFAQDNILNTGLDFPPIEVLQDSVSSANCEEDDSSSIFGVEKAQREPLFLAGSDHEQFHQDEKIGGDGEIRHGEWADSGTRISAPYV